MAPRKSDSLYYSLSNQLFPLRSDEIVNLRNSKPSPGERREAVSIPPETAPGSETKETSSINQSNSETAADEKTETGSAQGENEDFQGTDGGDEADTSDEDSTDRVGEDDAALLDRNLGGDEEGATQVKDDHVDELDEKTTQVTAMMKRILNMASSTGEKGLVPLNSEETIESAGGKPSSLHNLCES